MVGASAVAAATSAGARRRSTAYRASCRSGVADRVLANDAGANTTPNCPALVITSCWERAGQKYSVASPVPETRTDCQPDGPNSSIVLPAFRAK